MLQHNTSDDVSPSPAEASDESERARALIDAAGHLLEEQGLEGLTIRAVLERTGLARRAFYERFAGKDDLVLAVFAKTLREAADFFRARGEPFSAPVDKLRALVVGLVTGVTEEKDGYGQRRVAAMVLEHLRLALTRPAELQAALAPLLDLITEEIAEGIRQGQVRDCDPALQATLIYNLIATTLHSELMMEPSLGRTRQRRQKLADEIWEFCCRAIAA